MSTNPVDILLIGIGGYGGIYVNALQAPPISGAVRIRAVVDPLADKSPRWPALREAGVPRFDSLEGFLNSGGDADLAVISSPIAFHADQTCVALEAGMNVLCEKPIAARIEDARRMIAARDASGNFLEIGYQWSFSQSIQRLKRDILAGYFGAPRDFRAWVAWPRGSDYYGRNRWAGRIRDDAGRWVCDSPANNATAHFLHNMLFLLGAGMGQSATPTAVTGECYRVNPIENFDAACCRIETAENVDVFFYTAHCVRESLGPFFQCNFEKAVVTRGADGDIRAAFADGDIVSYGNPDRNNLRKLEYCLARCRADGAGRTICGPEAALSQTLCIQGLQQLSVQDLAAPYVEKKQMGHQEVLRCVPGLEDAMRQACDSGRLLSEMNLPWTRPAQRVACSSSFSQLPGLMVREK